MNIFANLWIISNCAFFLWLAGFTILRTEKLALSLGYAIIDDTGRAEVVATYAGLQIGIAALLLFFLKTNPKLSLTVLAFLYSGWCLGRLYAVTTRSVYDKTTLIYVGIEVVGSIVSILLCWLYK